MLKVANRTCLRIVHSTNGHRARSKGETRVVRVIHAHSTNDDDQAMALAEALIEPHRSWRIKIASRCP